MADFIPREEGDFFGWQDNHINVIVANNASWGVIPAEVTALQALQTDYVNAYNIGSKEHKLTRTSGQRQAFQDAEAAYIAGIRKFYGKWIAKNDLVTNAQRIDMGVTVYDTTRTPVQPVDFAPTVSVDKISRGEHKLRFANPQDPNTKAFPNGQKIILKFAIGAADSRKSDSLEQPAYEGNEIPA